MSQSRRAIAANLPGVGQMVSPFPAGLQGRIGRKVWGASGSAAISAQDYPRRFGSQGDHKAPPFHLVLTDRGERFSAFALGGLLHLHIPPEGQPSELGVTNHVGARIHRVAEEAGPIVPRIPVDMEGGGVGVEAAGAEPFLGVLST
jgi:hypothetical protein